MTRRNPNVFEVVFNIIILLSFALDLYCLISSLAEFARAKNTEGSESISPALGAAILMVFFLVGFFALLGVSLIKWIIYMRRSVRFRGAAKTWLIQLPFFAVGVVACLVIASFGLISTNDFSPILLALFALASGALVTFVFSDTDFWTMPFRREVTTSDGEENADPQNTDGSAE